MTEDEAFIRRIVDSPGDDTPRLVYADWLDERGDPRGAYLRAEADTPGEMGRLSPMTVGLDAVWVARVSRPPVGVCWEHLRPLSRPVGLVAAERVLFEQRHRIDLPPQLRAFWTNWNGAEPLRRRIDALAGGFDDESDVCVTRFLPVLPDHHLSSGVERVGVIMETTGRGTFRCVDFANARSDRPTNSLLMSLNFEDVGSVFYRQASRRRPLNVTWLVPISPSLGHLLARLIEEDDHSADPYS